MNPVSKQVIALLSEHDWYEQQPQLVMVDDIDFQFDAVLKGPLGGEGLVVVATSDRHHIGTVVSRLRALSTVMLRSGSTRPLAAVVIADDLVPAQVEELSTVCRVILVSDCKPDSVKRFLRPLLPIEFPTPQSTTARPIELLREALGQQGESSLMKSLLTAAGENAGMVQEQMQREIEATIAAHEDDGLDGDNA
jgi:hypothetical protein